jgi:hypothetical protein
LFASSKMNVVTHYRLIKIISAAVHSVHYARKVVLIFWTCSRKLNHHWRERRANFGLEKQKTFGDVTGISIL